MIHNNLELLNLSRELMIEIHKMTVLLANIQIFDDAAKVTQSVSSLNAMDAFTGKKHYKYEFRKILVNHHHVSQYGDHLEALFEKGKLTHENLYAALKNKLERLSIMINGFSQTGENENIHLQNQP